MEFKKDQSAGYLLNHLARLFARNLQAGLKPLGLSTGVFPALLELWEKEGLTQKDLVARLDIEQATMANTLNRMERDGLIQRKAAPHDGRVQQIWLTDKARALYAPATQAAARVNAEALGDLSRAEQEQLLFALRRVLARMTDG